MSLYSPPRASPSPPHPPRPTEPSYVQQVHIYWHQTSRSGWSRAEPTGNRTELNTRRYKLPMHPVLMLTCQLLAHRLEGVIPSNGHRKKGTGNTYIRPRSSSGANVQRGADFETPATSVTDPNIAPCLLGGINMAAKARSVEHKAI